MRSTILNLRVHLSAVWTRWLSFLGRFQKADVSLITDHDLTNLLKEIGQFNALVNGELRCAHCNTVLTFENLAGFVIKEGRYAFLCDAKICLGAMSSP